MTSGGPPEGILLADYPKVPLAEELITKLVEDTHDYAHANGLVMRTREANTSSDVCQTCPIALLPSPFPRKIFQQAVQVQDIIAQLYHEIAYDYDFLLKCHENVIQTDPFTKGLVDILKAVKEQGLAQETTLAIQRSDYMCHKDPFTNEYCLRQIEVNNIASSMGAHAERATRLHRRTFAQLGYDKEFIDKALPEDNQPIALIAEALFLAWKSFDNKNAVVLVVIEDENMNQIDQRHVEFKLEELGVPVDQIVRKTLTQCYECLTLSPERHLLYSGSRIAIVYFRSGYGPQHYHSDREWEARKRMELSDAIKTPWIGLQVANTKKTQQVLAEDGVVERYIGDPRQAASIRATFAGLWSIEGNDPLTRKMVQGAISHPSQFVLKPQLEGGGGNFYSESMVNKLQILKPEERAAFILMERIHPMRIENYLLRANQEPVLLKCVSELGIYGYAFGKRGEALLKTGGHLLRTKGETVDEVG
ncbi:hypothetical protein WR25_08118 isoform B [Diploscapter pachys]|uniref:Glutathione synthetase n=1 Tax=Diploscapter pachys TaxID=2018661 RepID=A0A2A2JL93_9BILA|nr:hypothetical protein WR25_08118 isoform B [Diploscapter pachys]